MYCNHFFHLAYFTYFRTVESFAPNRAPGFEVGTRRSEISAGMNRIAVLRVNESVIFSALVRLTSLSHTRLNCN
jgi:hypothetical protein